MKIQPLTLLQRAVIQRLRENGWELLADRALAQWSAGIALPDLDSVTQSEMRPALLADFEKANTHASPGARPR